MSFLIVMQQPASISDSESESGGYRCVYCEHVSVCKNNFCPNCGASMTEGRNASRYEASESEAETEAWSSDRDDSDEETDAQRSVFFPSFEQLAEAARQRTRETAEQLAEANRRRTRETAFGTPRRDPVPEVMPTRPSTSRARPIPGPWLTPRRLPALVASPESNPEPRAKRPSVVDLTCEYCPICMEVCTYLISCGQCSSPVCSACWARVSRCPFCRIVIKL